MALGKRWSHSTALRVSYSILYLLFGWTYGSYLSSISGRKCQGLAKIQETIFWLGSDRAVVVALGQDAAYRHSHGNELLSIKVHTPVVHGMWHPYNPPLRHRNPPSIVHQSLRRRLHAKNLRCLPEASPFQYQYQRQRKTHIRQAHTMAQNADAKRLQTTDRP
ncbi:hypothetical protein B0J11DRAFT_66584 [Dendryphion nanum]|uniref:Uncharacterized protein n=1 Tax=Dendryphion nanum TaxID=256645 RepID=A0A9P9DJD0_9PLEO|nr:hypothetical protein B0J11DRAFT_66584 [Dendryphion nanum]